MRQTFTILYDGGCKPQYHVSYGSYVVVSPTEGVIAESSKYWHFTGNHDSQMAEYRILHRALNSLLRQLQRRQINPSDIFVYVYGDNSSVRDQCNGKARCRPRDLQQMSHKVRGQLTTFGGYKAKRLHRKRIKMILGH